MTNNSRAKLTWTRCSCGHLAQDHNTPVEGTGLDDNMPQYRCDFGTTCQDPNCSVQHLCRCTGYDGTFVRVALAAYVVPGVGLEPDGMRDGTNRQCTSCGNPVPWQEARADSCGNAYCPTCSLKVDTEGCVLAYGPLADPTAPTFSGTDNPEV